MEITQWLQDKDIQHLLTKADRAETLIQVDQLLVCFGITNMEHLQALVEAFIPQDMDGQSSVAAADVCRNVMVL